jgi:hypothetical protein
MAMLIFHRFHQVFAIRLLQYCLEVKQTIASTIGMGRTIATARLL